MITVCISATLEKLCSTSSRSLGPLESVELPSEQLSLTKIVIKNQYISSRFTDFMSL